MKKPAKRPKIPAASTKAALIDAVIHLLAERSAADISVRDAAARAGVNHGLVHRYFGSKDDLVRAAIRQTSALVDAARPATPRTAWSYALFRARPELALIIARCCLDGPRDVLRHVAPPPRLRREFYGLIRAALDRAGLGRTIDARVLNAVGVSALLGWIVFRPLLDEGFDLPKDADDRVAQIAALVDSMVIGEED
jgi:AcrR family transcriptional regulator